MGELEKYFEQFRSNIIGIDECYESPYGMQKISYFDWIASGRLYKPIEDRISNTIGPYVANTHTEASETGSRMTWAYHQALRIIKRHVNAGPDDVIIAAGSGMTTEINKLIRMLGLKRCDTKFDPKTLGNERPVVFITHMEHHSNQTPWYETIAEVVVLPPGDGLFVDPDSLEKELQKYGERTMKIGSFSACSNVTGVHTPFNKLAKIMHQHGGVCFIDYAASAPYEDIDMHPADPLEKIDAVFFSPHKFLGGPGSSGILVFDSALYHSKVPDNPGGGTVDWTNPWGEYKYVDDIEAREDGGTPGFIQAIKAALSMQLKEQMGTEKILAREKEITDVLLKELRKIQGLKLLANNIDDRLGVVSFYIENIHYNLIVKLLSDRFGIQVRGGCACAGTYGHYLLEVSYDQSHEITSRINTGDLSDKPGWVRISIHPTSSDKEVENLIDAISQIARNSETWVKDYDYNRKKNEFNYKGAICEGKEIISTWFKL
jgi:selenocysteine lyase/cysteine desulfurase